VPLLLSNPVVAHARILSVLCARRAVRTKRLASVAFVVGLEEGDPLDLGCIVST
jgi:hypothetical protein